MPIKPLIKKETKNIDQNYVHYLLEKIKKNLNFINIELIVYIKRKDLRLTADYPEDLILLRAVYAKFKRHYPHIPLKKLLIS